MVLFAAFDPFRFSRIGNLDLLDGIKNKVAGVKFYPPSGYRPSG